jgi:hypothetical protein
MTTQKQRKTFSLEEKLKMLWDVEKHVGTLFPYLSKQLGISVSTLSTIIKNHNIIVEDANHASQWQRSENT